MQPTTPVTTTGNDSPAESKKKKIKQTLNMAGGFIAGTMASVAAADAANIINVYDLLHANKPVEPTVAPAETPAVVPDDIQVANNISDTSSFNEAYEQARQQVGPGGIFTWHGQVFNTYNSHEWNALSAEQRAQFFDQADIENLDIPDYDPPPVYTPVPVHHEPNVQTVSVHSHQKDDDTDIYESLLLDEPVATDTDNQEITTDQLPEVPVTDALENGDNNVPDVPVTEAPEDVEIDTSFDAAPAVTVSTKLDAPAGSSATTPDEYMVVVDGNSNALGVDQNHDGKMEAIIMDNNNDGKIETIYVSSTNDNVMNVVVHDDNQDGQPDSVDPLGEAPKDDFDFDKPDPAEFDPNADVEAWK